MFPAVPVHEAAAEATILAAGILTAVTGAAVITDENTEKSMACIRHRFF